MDPTTGMYRGKQIMTVGGATPVAVVKSKKKVATKKTEVADTAEKK